MGQKALVMPGVDTGSFGGLRGPAYRALVPDALPLVKAMFMTGTML
jgi:hypothetical protein